MASFDAFRQRAETLMSDVYALYLARNDPRIPWYARALIILTVIYALSPIDLIPDFIPWIGYLDDLILIPAGIALALRFISEDVWTEYRQKAREGFAGITLDSWQGVLLILFIVLGLWKILALGLFTSLIGIILMVVLSLYTPSGLLNGGTFVLALGIVILIIAMAKFHRNLRSWQTKLQSSQNREPGSP